MGVQTAFGNRDETWKALLGGRCALKVYEWRNRQVQMSRIWSNEPTIEEIGEFVFDMRTVRPIPGVDQDAELLFCTTKGGAGLVKGVGPFAPVRVVEKLRQHTVSNACASGAQGVIEGVDLLTDGDCTTVNVHGLDHLTSFIVDGFLALNATAPTRVRPFDRSRDGLGLGEAAAGIRLITYGRSTAPRIVSYGCSNDANHISGPSRDGSGLALAIERALDGIDKSEIRAICAHGTATEYNDAMEARAFHTVFGGNPPPVFGIKGAIGHTLGAAGLIEVIVSALVATEGVIPPTVGFEQGEDDFPLDVVHGEPRKIEPGYVLTTNSGFGGMNTAIVVGPGKQ